MIEINRQKQRTDSLHHQISEITESADLEPAELSNRETAILESGYLLADYLIVSIQYQHSITSPVTKENKARLTKLHELMAASEVLGAVEVLQTINISPDKYQTLVDAFGFDHFRIMEIGLERLVRGATPEVRLKVLKVLESRESKATTPGQVSLIKGQKSYLLRSF